MRKGGSKSLMYLFYLVLFSGIGCGLLFPQLGGYRHAVPYFIGSTLFLNFLEITAVMVIICFFIALPSVPGFWGLWEAGGIFALYLFGVNTAAAAGFTLANHAVQIFPVIIAGMISAAITGINIRDMSFNQKTDIQKPEMIIK